MVGSWRISEIVKIMKTPSRNLEILNYTIKVSMVDGKKCIALINPVVKNLGSEVAYIWSVQVVISNSSHIFLQTYSTVGKDSRDGLIEPG